MLTERDILNAWLCWGKAGRVPPPAADAGELRTKVRHMLARFLYADRNLFLAAAKRALKYRIAKTALYDKENNYHVCPSCKVKVERSDYEFNTGYCKVCGQKIEFKS